MCYSIVFIQVLIILPYCTHSAFDLNIHHLQYVADSLTIAECRELVSLLENFKEDLYVYTYSNTFGMSYSNHMRAKIRQEVLPKQRQFTNCILELVHWNQNDTSNTETFHLLKGHLIFMHKDDIVHRLTKSVNDEIGSDLKYFLNQVINFKTKRFEENKVETRFEDIVVTSKNLQFSVIKKIIFLLTGVFLFLIVSCFSIWLLFQRVKKKMPSYSRVD
jgi:hypothetical protein